MITGVVLFAVEAAAEEAGGLFDLDATLPLMAIQFVLLAIVLNAVFYKPLGKAIDERDGYVRSTIADAEERLVKAKKLADEYEQALASARLEAKQIVEEAQTEAQKIGAQTVASAQQEAQAKREAVQKELDAQKQSALTALEQQVDTLSQQIMSKLLGAAA
ncbi:MAG: F0F1 ATP synthase subunit B' [Cyanobacteria bacterium P01_D01_bin.156]